MTRIVFHSFLLNVMRLLCRSYVDDVKAVSVSVNNVATSSKSDISRNSSRSSIHGKPINAPSALPIQSPSQVTLTGLVELLFQQGKR